MYKVEEFSGTPQELENFINNKAAAGITLVQIIPVASAYLIVFIYG